MTIARLLALIALCAASAFAAELHGTWSASSGGSDFGGSWTAQPQSGGVTGAWTLFDAGGRTVMQGGWSASKSAKAWNGAWRATVTGRAGDYAGTWAADLKLPADAQLSEMLEAALKAVVSGSWKAGGSSGGWSIRAAP